MSAYIVEDAVLNRIVSWLCEERHVAVPGYDLNKFDPPMSEHRPDADRLFLDLLNMNVDAVQQRYPDDKPEELPGPIADTGGFKYMLIESEFAVLKSMRCLLYQCSEGDVPERKLYKDMHEVCYGLAMRIINNMPEYDRAPGW